MPKKMRQPESKEMPLCCTAASTNHEGAAKHQMEGCTEMAEKEILKLILSFDTLQMNERGELIKNLAGITVTAGLALAATVGGTGAVATVAAGIAGNLASSFIEKTEYSKLQKLLGESSPADLNHDLKKLVVKAVEWSILNIRFLYKKEVALTSVQVDELNRFSDRLIEEVHLLQQTLTASDDSIRSIIEKPKSREEALETFDLNTAAFPEISPDSPYPLFFREYFEGNLQLCFGELLKNEKNRPAYIAYQREVYRSLDENIYQLQLQNEQILKELSGSGSEGRKAIQKRTIRGWKETRRKLRDTHEAKVSSEFDMVFSEHLAKLKEQLPVLIDLKSLMEGYFIDLDQKMLRVDRNVSDIKQLTKEHSSVLQKNWIPKQKVLAVSVLSVLTAAIIGIVWYYHSVPFDIKMYVSQEKLLKLHPEYPPLPQDATLRFYLPGGIREREISSSGEVMLPDVPGDIEDMRVKVVLVGRYWKLVEDSIDLKRINTELFVKPNEELALIRGNVIVENGAGPLEGVRVQMEELGTFSNQEGIFEIYVPLSQRRLYYELKAEKRGYKTVFGVGCVAGDEKLIRMGKNNLQVPL